ncbi:Saposin B-type domain-containing protein [Mycena venus]|uniref:Saposin B-type domain-containing protein n=1 Tax=Mycena venus TaxID=2733690 RepID=A0A8H7CCZ0_9AGAR|nr:Saposin B-type domain-containing protein [Mycena venus]
MAEHIDFNATIGPEEVGVIVGIQLFQVLQITMSWPGLIGLSYFPNDSTRLKTMLQGRRVVVVISILELFHVILSCVALYATTVTHFGDEDHVLQINKAIGLSLLISAIVVDFIVAVALCAQLWQCRTRSGVKTTQQAIDSLLAWTINTGLLTSAASIMMVIFFVTMANFAWLTMLLVIPRLFANSMIASLNGRNKFRNNDNTHLFVAGVQSSPGGSNNDRKFPAAIAIEMSRTQEVVHDPADTKV